MIWKWYVVPAPATNGTCALPRAWVAHPTSSREPMSSPVKTAMETACAVPNVFAIMPRSAGATRRYHTVSPIGAQPAG